MTNFEAIKNMTVDEMAFEIICNLKSYCDYCVYDGTTACGDGYNCEEGIEQWLESEVSK
jgi:hypothetical protein